LVEERTRREDVWTPLNEVADSVLAYVATHGRRLDRAVVLAHLESVQPNDHDRVEGS
jgi:hypothetical protein